MITGYNTDVRHQEVVFHVQTEDKGTANPFIESLVYVGGQVMASKRVSYADLLAAGRDEREIVAFMDHQHRTMIAAIRHGKFDAKLATLVAKPKTSPVPEVSPTLAGSAIAATHGGGAGAPPPPGPRGAPPAPAPQAAQAARASRVMATIPGPAGAAIAPGAAATAIPPGTAVVPGAGGLAAAGAATSAAASGAGGAAARPPLPERTLDQVILEYLTNEADQEQLVLVLEGEADLAIGRRASLALRTSSSKSGLPVAGAQVSVRMISTISEPRVLAIGRTDEQGSLPLRFEIPPLDRGTAALIISAVSAIGRAELKHLL
jgi:hypothetical protein